MWNLTPSERLRYWHDFRKKISEQSKEDAIKETHHLWCYAPFVSHYLTTDQIATWPNPWELVNDNYYCDLAKSLGMVYTLYLTSHAIESTIEIYRDEISKDNYNLVYIDGGKYVLNYLHDEVINKKQIQSGLRHIKSITTTDLSLHKLR
jgi:hypothetical protein